MVKFKKSRKKVTFFLHLNIECPQYRRRSERKRAEMAALGGGTSSSILSAGG